MKIKPIRIQRSRQHKQVSPNGLPIIYIGRPSKFGNPFKMGQMVSSQYFEMFDEPDTRIFFSGKKLITREDACYLYEKYLYDQQMQYKEFLRGKNLSCWCGPGVRCHGDILLKWVNDF